MKELSCDILIAGGGAGGCAAAMAALRNGYRVILIEEYGRVGGQFTSQAVPPDEHPWIEMFGATRSYRRFRNDIREHYRKYYPLTHDAATCEHLNPGNGFVSALCHEPKISRIVLESYFAPYQAGGQLTLLLHHTPISAETDHDTITSVTFADKYGEKTAVAAKYFIDATELGDLLPLTGTEFVTGSEAQKDTGEPHASPEAMPLNQQAISFCFIIDYCPGENHIIEKPVSYDFWRNYVPDIRPSWGGPLLSWQATHPITLEPVVRSFNPIHPKPERGPMDLWTFRRIADKANFRPGCYASDIVLVNWPQIDYMLGPVVGVTPEEKAKHLQGARELSLSMMYWMQTEAPREDGGQGLPGLRLRPDITETPDGLAEAPYIRESRRIKGKFTILEQHVSTEARREMGKDFAFPFKDSVGIGAYRIDLHPSCGGDNYIDVGALPFQIPLGALLPVRMKNLIAGGKNIAATHITNGCYRLHPVEWNIGESAALCASFCLSNNRSPHELYEHESILQDFQSLLSKEGIEQEWPKVNSL